MLCFFFFFLFSFLFLFFFFLFLFEQGDPKGLDQLLQIISNVLNNFQPLPKYVNFLYLYWVQLKCVQSN